MGRLPIRIIDNKLQLKALKLYYQKGFTRRKVCDKLQIKPYTFDWLYNNATIKGLEILVINREV